jgi:gliding motility-associated lipoprotein GldD
MRYKYLLIPALITLMFVSCRPNTPIPKPKGYFRYEFPEHAYQTFDSTSFPFTFEYPVYGKVTEDANLNRAENSPYWINVTFPQWDATIYLSYKEITTENTLDKLVAESYKLSSKHDVRADYINTPQFKTRNGLSGVFYNVGGNAASAYQFFITDKTKHFLRGALYFNVPPNADSLMPATEFLKKDMEQLVETLRFK